LLSLTILNETHSIMSFLQVPASLLSTFRCLPQETLYLLAASQLPVCSTYLITTILGYES
jgi:hypothetical protein